MMVLRMRLGVALVVMMVVVVVVTIQILISTPKVTGIIIIIRGCRDVVCICNNGSRCVGSAICFLQGILQW